jgi:DNA (cytosine-5)-methyltransferase 1
LDGQKQWHYKWRLNERKGSEYIKHFGDITQLTGHELPVVDCIIGGSPCQDLSVAGKRAGLAGERSGLFMEQMRVVKEMREQDVRTTGRSGFLVRPRYMVWENVPGALSSGKPKGADFQAVLEEIVKIVCKEAPPVPIPKDGWPKAGCISGVGDSGCTFSVCWRLHDAQYWGVPQRRKRIALVADFGGLSAPEILFERQGLRWDSEQSAEERQGAAV